MKTTKEKEKKAFDFFKKEFGYKNQAQSPVISKIMISSGIGSLKTNKDKIKVVEDRLTKITGQKPSECIAKKSIASFGLREGNKVGYKVTLRGERMYSFLDKLINIAIPRTKDFRGLSRDNIDEMGNLTIGIKEHIIFPETPDEELRDVFGLSVTIVTTAKNKKEASAFFDQIGIPFKKEK